MGVAAAVLIAAVLRFARSLGERLCRYDKAGTGWTTVFGRAIAKTGNLFIFAVSARLVVHFAQAPAPVAEVFNFIFVLASAFQAAVWARELVLGFVEHRTRTVEGDTLGSALGIIRLLVTVVLFAIAVIVVLDNLGVNVTGLVAGLGVGGIAIGLAAQGIFKDLFAALSILFDRPFRRGDTIKFGTAFTGKVEAIGLKTTRVRALDGDQVIVSNDRLLSDIIRNLHDIEERRVLLTLPLLYANDPAMLETLPGELERIVAAEPHCEFGHAWLIAFDANAVTLELMFHVRGNAESMYRARHEVMIAAMKRMRELDIRFFYPTPPPEVPPGPEQHLGD